MESVHTIVELLAALVAAGGISLSRQLLAERLHQDAREALAAGRGEDALTAARRSLRLAGERVDAYYTEAAALARLDRGSEAVASLRAAADREPRNFVTYVLLGDLTLRTGDAVLAADWYRSASILTPADEGIERQWRETAALARRQQRGA